jgi:glycosyltransferase involved in cell wall biosynthesis
MIIGIDGNEANQTIRVGVGQYAYHLLCQLSKRNKNHQFIIFLKNPPLADLPKTSKLWRYLIIGPKPLWTKIALPLYLVTTRQKIDYFYSPSHYSPFPSAIPTIPTIHDIGYLKYQNQFKKKDFFQLKNWTQQSINQAKYIMAVSEFTKNELIKTYHLSPKKIFVIPNGVNKPPKKSLSLNQKTLKKFSITKPFFLSVGTLKPNKNYGFLIKSFAQFLKIKPDSFQLVIAGKKGWLFDEIYQTVVDTHTQNDVIFTDFITESEKWALYRQATATVIPSTYEGFGIPAIESLMVNTPVICSDIPVFKEVLKKQAIYINPNKIKTLTAALQKITKYQRHKLTQPKYNLS